MLYLILGGYIIRTKMFLGFILSIGILPLDSNSRKSNNSNLIYNKSKVNINNNLKIILEH